MIEIEKNFDLAQTLDCGQAFRWTQKEDFWLGCVKNKVLKICEKDDKIILDCDENDFEKIWKNYFDLNTDYIKIRTELSELSPVLKQAADFAPGIHILCQDPWEALCSFIISQNNNIPRIKGIIWKLCENFGEDLGEIYSFPSAETVAKLSLDDLAPIKSGFRAKYILSAANAVLNQEIDMENLYTMPLDAARKELMKIKGVGPKVADCALLYGFHRTSCFPMDVWMKRAMETLFPNNSPEDFGENAGIAQQYIFHYSRMNPNLFE
ncbi:MAG: DNA-3-methyladenine glycosylase [Clostridia bacterium]